MEHLQGGDLQNLRSVSRALIETDLRSLEIKQMAEFENVYRRRCRLAIQLYKNWLRDYEAETDCMQVVYGTIEGVLLRRQAEDAVRLYWIIRQDFRIALRNYLARVTHNTMCKSTA